MQEFKLELDFPSFFKLACLIGLCFGIGAVPLVIFSNWEMLGVNAIFFGALGAPLMGLINGALSGVIGFPAYYWLRSRVGLPLRGRIFPLLAKP